MVLNEQMQEAIQEDIADTRSKKDRLKDQMEGLTRMGVSAVASPILGAGDIVDIASSIPEMPPKAAVMFPTIAGLHSGFNAAKQAGLDREKAEELIEYITGVELQGDSVELFGEIVGIPGGASLLKGVTNVIKKYGDAAPKYINEIKAEALELQLWEKSLPFSGTADLICKRKNPKTGKFERWLIDFKTGRENPEVELQLTFYKRLFEKIYKKKIGWYW